MKLCVMPLGDKSQAFKAREMTLKIRHGNGAVIVVKAVNDRIMAKGSRLFN